ncbi:hypothetical protein [Longimicrobium sp.]|uniref:hypothetical protein n=1 Tax=Longimicrobium sp. TaxID=2029185 RepID=UPI002C98C70E|nr:hypothetical protein [Longimicrobium sp.]HSU14282.1 hypothetical protein [Longimicrobium sp.]
MIKPNVRASFGRREAELLLAVTGPGGEERLREEGFDALLDDVGVLRELLRRDGLSRAPAPLVFYLLVRHALLQREIHDRQLADYTAGVLLEFGLQGRAGRVDGGEGEPFTYLVDILGAIERARGEREFLLRVHLGNYALWLAGMFPDHITHRVQRRAAPPISYYDAMGATGFRTAAGNEIALRHGLGELFLRVSDRFADVRAALNSLSDAVLFPRSKDPVDRVLRQVTDDFRRNFGE